MSDKFLAGGITAGAVSVSLPAQLVATTTQADVTGKVAADVTASYWRQGGVRVAITVADLGSVNAAYSAGGFKEVDATNMPGAYRFDVPDAALATGADWVVVFLKVAGCISIPFRLDLTTYTPISSALLASIVETEGSYTVKQALSIALAVLAGQSTSGGATLKTPNGAATRVAATVNGSNERTAMTLTPSA